MRRPPRRSVSVGRSTGEAEHRSAFAVLSRPNVIRLVTGACVVALAVDPDREGERRVDAREPRSHAQGTRRRGPALVRRAERGRERRRPHRAARARPDDRRSARRARASRRDRARASDVRECVARLHERHWNECNGLGRRRAQLIGRANDQDDAAIDDTDRVHRRSQGAAQGPRRRAGPAPRRAAGRRVEARHARRAPGDAARPRPPRRRDGRPAVGRARAVRGQRGRARRCAADGTTGPRRRAGP